MTYKGDPIAEKLDRLAEATGVPRLNRRLEAAGPPDPIRFRVLPLVLLVLATGGLVLQMVHPWTYGYLLMLGAWFPTLFVFNFGPLGRRPGRKLDEREAAVVRHGHLIGLIAAFCAALLGSFTIMFGKMGEMLHTWRLWAPETAFDWFAITFFLLAVEANVAVLAASRATPEPLEDEED